ncbi:iron chaperone [Luteococcus sp. Sow4_B9]|uniref:iron chaperone n=1 Tax=Luteococcus sp. Sow4_B9 TaxID=3438792 RepID=UPI003F9E95D2
MTVVDDYLAGCREEDRDCLEQMRRVVHDCCPGLDEVTSYRLPAFRLHGYTTSKGIVGGFAAGRSFLSWYPFCGRTLVTLADELSGFEQTSGSVHFSALRPLPEELVVRLVHTRLAEILELS